MGIKKAKTKKIPIWTSTRRWCTKVQNQHQVLIFLLVACLPLFFSGSIFTFLNSPGVQDHLNTPIAFFVLWVVLLSISIYLFPYFQRYAITSPFLSAYCLVYLVFFFLMAASPELKNPNGQPNIVVIHAVFIAMLAFFIVLFQISSYTARKKKSEHNEEPRISGLIVDEPISSYEEDKFDRKEAALKVARLILRTNSKKSFAFGLSAEWGSGKSSFLNMIRETIHETEDLITIQFKPWASHSPDQVIADFFDELDQALSPYRLNLSKVIKAYSKALQSAEQSGIVQNLNSLIDFIHPNQTTRELYETLNDIIQSIDKKIVIEIDDLDRLDKSEIVAVLKLIRNTANFYNTFFIVAYDREYVVNAIRSINDAKAHIYLEKIFQAEVHLPGFDKRKLRELLGYNLKHRMEEHEIAMLSSLFEENGPDTDAMKEFLVKGESAKPVTMYCLANYRDVVRLCNQIILVYDKNIGQEIDLRVFFKIQILRLKFAEELDYFYKHYTQILLRRSLPTGNWLTIKKNESVKPGEGKPEVDNYTYSEGYKRFINYVEENNKENSYLLLREIESMFPPAEQAPQTLSIQWEARFNIAFGINLFGNYFSETAFQNHLAEGGMSSQAYWSRVEGQNAKLKLVKRLEDLNEYRTAQELRKVLTLWFLVFEEDIVNIINRADHLLEQSTVNQLLSKLEVDPLSKDEYSNFLLELFNAILPLQIRSKIIGDLLVYKYTQAKDKSWVLPNEKLQSLNFDIFKRELTKWGMTTQVLDYFSLCIAGVDDDGRILSEEATSTMYNKIAEHKEEYIQLIIRKVKNKGIESEYFFDPFRGQIFNPKRKFTFETWLSNEASVNEKAKEVNDIYKQAKEEGVLDGFVFSGKVRKPEWLD